MTATARAIEPGRGSRVRATVRGAKPSARGLPVMFAAEAASGLLGFAAMVTLGRRLGPGAFGRVEFGAAVAAWLLVLVRGGFDTIVYREAARRPALIGPLTDLLFQLRALAALAGFCASALVAGAVGPGQAGAVPASSLLLFAAVGAADVGPRATGQLGVVALAQTLRAAGLLGAVLVLVRGPGDVFAAAVCPVAAELLSSMVLLRHHRSRYPAWRWRWRGRGAAAVARRATVAGLSRFARVTLYGLDMLVLGWWATQEIGAYAAGRRLVFAAVALGLVVPSALAPAIARAWAEGVEPAARGCGRGMAGLWAIALPATLGLVLTGDRMVPWLFGTGFVDGGPWLTLVALRLPWLLSSSFAQSALVACRREGDGLLVTAWQCAAAVLTLPVAAVFYGTWGVGVAIVTVEATGAFVGWRLLARLGVATRAALPPVPTLIGCAALVAGCHLSDTQPFPVTVLTGLVCFAVPWCLARHPLRTSEGPA